MNSTNLSATFYALLGVCVVAAMLTGSTLQWIWANGKLKSQYNFLVVVAAIASLIQTVACYINVIMTPNNSLPFIIYILVNWVVMTHFSVMLVSKKLSLTFIKSEQPKMWRRLLLINAFMLPLSLFICVYWASAQSIQNDTFTRINEIMEPIQIALWGLIEFCLSGAFVAQMWKYKWSDVERKAIYVLLLVGACDVLSVLLNIFLGDLESTSVKGFVYCLRIRLEVAVLGQMVDYVRKRRNPPTATHGVTTLEEMKARGEEPAGQPGTRVPAGKSWAMITLTQAIAEDDDNDHSEGDTDKTAAGKTCVRFQDEGLPGTRVPAGKSWAMLALTEVVMDDEDDEEEYGVVGDKEVYLDEETGHIVKDHHKDPLTDDDGMDRTAITDSEESGSSLMKDTDDMV